MFVKGLKTISDVAREYGVDEEQLRYWDRIGILVPRRVGAVRVYSEDDERKLSYISRLMREGYRATEIRNFLMATSWVDEPSTSQVKALHGLMEQATRGAVVRQPFGLNTYNTVYRRVQRAAHRAGRQVSISTSEDGQALEAEVLK